MRHHQEVIRMLNSQTSSLGFELTRFLASLQALDWICFSEAQAWLPKHTCKIHSHQVRHLPVGFLILLSPDIHLQIINSPNWSPYISLKNLLREFDKRSLVIISSTLITISLGNIWILLGENWCWSILGLKGLTLFILFELFISVI